MKRIAILFEGEIYNRKGLVNAVINRSKYLIEASDEYTIDVFMINRYDPFYIQLLRKSKPVEKKSEIYIDNIKINLLWFPLLLADWVFESKLKHRPILFESYIKYIAKYFKGYDLLIAHSYYAGITASLVNEKYGIPYIVNWHGSDIHTLPFRNSHMYNVTKNIMEKSSYSCFVSRELMKISDSITKNANKIVLYNGCDNRFKKYDDVTVTTLKSKYDVIGKRVISFVGNFYEVKNVLLIPSIYKLIYKKRQDVVFWMIGDGKLEGQVKSDTVGLPIKFWGKKDTEEIINLLNCTDVLILPSKNEGLPLILLEALNCGCNVVASEVGGIPEVIGKDNCVPLLKDNFIELFAEQVIQKLEPNNVFNYPSIEIFDWTKTAVQEKKIISKYIE